ncbi:MAG: AAA family ATPase [Neptuniibacter sp.]
MIKFSEIVQIKSVWPGYLGGAVFSAYPLSSKKAVTFRANWKTFTHPPKSGEFWLVKGQFYDDPIYGEQVEVKQCHLQPLPGHLFLRSYLLNNRRFRGFSLGKKKIDKLISEVGNEKLVIDLLNENKWKHIADVLHENIAKILCERWAQAQNEIDTITFLVEHNFNPQLCKKVISLCQANTVERLTNNPFHLLAFGGIARSIWKTVDACSTKLNIAFDDPRRLIGAIEHVMYERLRKGHTAATEEELLEAATKILKTPNQAEKAIESALKAQAICITSISKNEVVYQAIGPAYIEHGLEQRIQRLLDGTMQQSLFNIEHSSLSETIQSYSNTLKISQGYQLTDQQEQAVLMALTERCSVITGYGGTGKTTILRAVVDIATEMNKPVYLMALAGKAKERMSQSTDAPATTIHAFIAAALMGKNSWVDLNCDPLLIIDEASMIDISLFNRLLKLFDKRSFSIVTVGDDAQLSPIGFGLAWHKMANSTIPTTKLTKVHRQAAESDLHRIAMKIRDGSTEPLPLWKGESEGVYLVEADKTSIRDKLKSLKKELPNAQILTPHMSEHMPDSGIVINVELQHALNISGTSGNTTGMRVGRYLIQPGDPVIVTENNYELNVFNGTTGTLISIKSQDDEGLTGVFEFDGYEENLILTEEQCHETGISLAYAISIHKSQGSEYQQTIVTSIAASNFVERSMMYTALTRSKKLCLIVGKQKIYEAAVTSLPRAETLRVGFNI